MAKRPIISIDVDDSKFKAFLELFQKYKDEVANLPGRWTQLDHAVEATGGQFHQMTALLMTQTQLITQALQEHAKFSTSVGNASEGMKKLAGETKSVASYLIDATKTLTKWAAAGGILGGLLGLGGLWGLERLAASASNARRSAGGLGVASGAMQAFETNYNRFFDPTGVLSNVAESKSDYARRWQFYTMGFSPDEVESKDPAELAAEMAPRAKRMWAGSDHSSQFAQYSGLSNFFTLEDLRRLERTPDSELEAARKRYDSDKGGMAVPDAVQRKWQDFLDQLDRAGTKIQNVFITDLAPLEPVFEDLSKGLVDLIDALMRNPQIKKWLEEVGDGLEHLARWIGTPDFKSDVDLFVTGLERAAVAVGNFAMKIAGWLEYWNGTGKPPNAADGVPAFGPGSNIGPNGEVIPEPGPPPPAWGNETFGDALQRLRNWLSNNPFRNQAILVDQLIGGDASLGAPHGTPWTREQGLGILGMLQAENHGMDPNAHNTAGGGRGAWGIAQWRGDRIDDFQRFAGYDIGDLSVSREKRLLDQIRFLNYELTEGKEKAHGDVIRGMRDAGDVADYGVRNVERPGAADVDDEARRARRNVEADRSRVTINVNNTTGGSAVVTTNQVANQ